MKKFLALLLCVVTVVAMTACKKAPAAMPNPMTEYESLEKVNELVGCNLVHPGVMGVTGERFFVISGGESDVAEYCFSVNSMPYVFRAAADPVQDISGLYVNAAPAFDGEAGEEMAYAEDGAFKAVRWYDGAFQYTLCVTDNGKMEKDTFLGIADELRTMTTYDESSSLVGSYQDSFSQRATAEVSANEDGTYLIRVHWGNSASSSANWEMNATLGEDGKLSYTDGTSCTIEFDEAGKENVTINATNQEGYFEVVDGKLLWTGAPDESCVDCVFEKV